MKSGGAGNAGPVGKDAASEKTVNYQARGRRSGPEYPEAAEPAVHLRALAEELHGTIAECIADAQVEAVHRVRTGSRRVEAMLETVMRAQGTRATATRGELAEAADRWLRQLDKVRRAAGKVRDLDVHRQIVDKHYLNPAGEIEIVTVTKNETVAAASPLHHQAKLLDGWLKHHREKRAVRLTKQLQKRRPKLQSAGEACLAALPQAARRDGRQARPVSMLALEDFLRLVDTMPVLDADNLHDFRKGAKKARYVAETGGEDREAKAIAKAINRVQDAIGDWHDFLILEDEAKQALGKNGAELREAIGRETARLLSSALRTTDTVRRRLVGEWLARRAKSGSRSLHTRAPRAQAGQRRPATASS